MALVYIRKDKKDDKAIDFLSLNDIDMKILVATEKPFAAAAIEGIREVVEGAGYSLELLEGYTQKSELLEAVENADALIVRSDIIDDAVVDYAKQLKIIVRAGAGFDNIDLETTANKSIVVMNTPGQNANAVAELVVGMMIFMARNQFTPGAGTELSGKRLGIHAYGNVGRQVAMYGKGLGMKVYALDPFLKDKSIFEKDGVTEVHSEEELYRNSDYLSLHIPATEQTIGSIGYDLLTLMPKGATLINSARQEVIDEKGIIKAFEERKDLKYATDVAATNQAELKEKFGNRVYSTPKKMGAQTAEANVNAGVAAARQIVDFFKNGNTNFKVN